jgi:hypothetical protein
MSATWYACKIKYLKTEEDGKQKKAIGQYLLDAISFTEAEARIISEAEKFTDSGFEVTDISKTNICELFPNKNGDRWFKAKVKFIITDENNGKEKKTNNYMLVEANTVKEAYDFLTEKLSGMIIPFIISDIDESPVLDVFPFFSDKEEIPEKLKPLIKKEVVIPEYDTKEKYIVGDTVMFGGCECIIISNGTNADFRRK